MAAVPTHSEWDACDLSFLAVAGSQGELSKYPRTVYTPINQGCNRTALESYHSCHLLSIYNVTGTLHTMSFNPSPATLNLRQVLSSPL